MSEEAKVVLIALLGGVGGAFLTGLFNAVLGIWADKRKKQHELDAWLREKRFEHFAALLEVAYDELPAVSDGDRSEQLRRYREILVRLGTVSPLSLQPALDRYKEVVGDELTKPFSERSVKAVAWEGGLLQAIYSRAMGWDQEPIETKPKEFLPHLVAYLRQREELARKRKAARSTSEGAGSTGKGG